MAALSHGRQGSVVTGMGSRSKQQSSILTVGDLGVGSRP